MNLNIEKTGLSIEPEDGLEKPVVKNKTYYPLIRFNIFLIRDPMPKMIQIFVPTIILGIFLYKCTEIYDLESRMENLAIVFLAYIQLFGQLRKEVPPLNTVTYGEIFVLCFIFTSLIPLIQPYSLVEEDQDPDAVLLFKYIILALYFIPIMCFLYKVISIYFIRNRIMILNEQKDKDKKKDKDLDSNEKKDKDKNEKPKKKYEDDGWRRP